MGQKLIGGRSNGHFESNRSEPKIAWCMTAISCRSLSLSARVKVEVKVAGKKVLHVASFVLSVAKTMKFSTMLMKLFVM